jgi:hypothetical protein
MISAGSFTDIDQAIGGDSCRKIARWIDRRVSYHRTRFEFIHEYEASKLYTLEQDDSDGSWRVINYEIDYDYQKESWYDFLEWMSRYPRSFERTYHRTQTLKEELMMKAWHPDRVCRWLEAGVLDDML